MSDHILVVLLAMAEMKKKTGQLSIVSIVLFAWGH